MTVCRNHKQIRMGMLSSVHRVHHFIIEFMVTCILKYMNHSPALVARLFIYLLLAVVAQHILGMIA